MRYKSFATAMLLLCCSCAENTVEPQDKTTEKPKTLRSLLTKASTPIPEDSLTVISKLQSDADNLMMGRIIQKDSIFVLAIKKEDALYLGISEDTYSRYLDYVARLNECSTK